jgi:hypothetical protein
MAPITAQRMIDIPSNAERPLPKPTLAKAAKITRMLVRRKKRMSTWVDLSSRDIFGSPNTRNSGASSFAALAEIVAADRLVQRIQVARYYGHAWPARRSGDSLGLDERAEDRQRQIRMVAFNRPVEPVRKLALA